MFTIYFVTKAILGAVMKFLVIGAIAKIAELKWRKVVSQGHDVTFFDRSAAHRYEGGPLREMVCVVFDGETVTHAVAGQQAVLVVSGRSAAVIRAV